MQLAKMADGRDLFFSQSAEIGEGPSVVVIGSPGKQDARPAAPKESGRDSQTGMTRDRETGALEVESKEDTGSRFRQRKRWPESCYQGCKPAYISRWLIGPHSSSYMTHCLAHCGREIRDGHESTYRCCASKARPRVPEWSYTASLFKAIHNACVSGQLVRGSCHG
jgi:hypothetical protein